MTLQKIEEALEEQKTFIKNYHDSEEFSMRFYWMKRMYKLSILITGLIKEEFNIEE